MGWPDDTRRDRHAAPCQRRRQEVAPFQTAFRHSGGHVLPPQARVLLAVDSFLNVVRALARTELDDPKIGEPVFEKRIFFDESFDEPSILADGQDDAAISRYLSTRDQEVAGGVVLLQESDVRGHVGVNVCERGLVDKFDYEHAAQLAPNSVRRKG